MPPHKIHFSPAIIARADTPIEECVALMKRHNVGSVMIVSDRGTQALLGIFTERDLLMKFDLIEAGRLWNKPIRTVMSHPVKVLLASQIDIAPEMMLKHGVRHMPIVVSDDQIKYRLVGIVSMRDLFRNLLADLRAGEAEEVPAKARGKAKIPKLGVFTLDPYLVKFLEEGLGELGTGIFHCSFSELKRGTIKANAFVLDLDHVRPSDWLDLLKDLNLNPRAPFTAIVFDPALYDLKTINVLKKLKETRNFVSFAKPIPVPMIFQKLVPFLK